MAADKVHSSLNIDSDEFFRTFKGENRAFAKKVLAITEELKPYWPLTVRQIYYQCVAQLIIDNLQREYEHVVRVVKALRVNDFLSWSSIEDRVRYTTAKRGMPEVSEYIEQELKILFHVGSYARCYVQKQPVYVELCVEKDALAKVVEDAAYPFCTRVNVLRGHPSATMRNEIANRFDAAIMKGRDPIIFHLGDLDPSGVEIPLALQRNLERDHSVRVDVRRLALTIDQVDKYQLPKSPQAAKSTDKNYSKFVKQFGTITPTELDALHPKHLQQIVTDALTNVYDMSDFAEQKRKEATERALLKEIRTDVCGYVEQRWGARIAQLREGDNDGIK